MGRIFGISDLPVSTIDKALEPLKFKSPKIYPLKPAKLYEADKFISVEKAAISNPFVKMRNGIGRLMSHFSGSNQKVKASRDVTY